MRGRVHRRGKGWAFVVDVGIDPVTGKRRQRTKGGFPTRKAAEAGMREVLNSVDEGSSVSPSAAQLFPLHRSRPPTVDGVRPGSVAYGLDWQDGVVGVYLTVYCRLDVPSDLTVLLEDGHSPVERCVRVSSGSPGPGRSWEVYDLTSPAQASPLSMEVHHGRHLGDELGEAVRLLPAVGFRDRVIAHLTDTVATVAFKLSLVKDEELFFGAVEAMTTMAGGLVFCEGDPAGFYDNVRGQPFLTLS
jgi:hypothetical protein